MKIFFAMRTAGFAVLALCIYFTAGSKPLHAGTALDLLTTPAQKSPPQVALGARLFDGVNTGKWLGLARERGGILFSGDKEESWIQADVPVSVSLTALTFPEPDTGWAVGHDGVILKTTDGGNSWHLQMDGNMANKILSHHIRSLIQTRKTTGQGLDIEDLEFFLQDADAPLEKGPARHFMDVWFKTTTKGFAIGAYGLIFATTDGGATWQSVFDRLDNIDGFHYYGITPAGDVLFIAGEAGTLFRSDDGGQSWNRLESPYQGSFFGILATPGGARVIAYGMEGRAYETLDFGNTWIHLNIDNQSSYSAGAVLPDGSIILSGSNGDLFMNQGGNRPFEKLGAQNQETTAMVQPQPGQILLTGLNGLFKTTTSK